MNSDQIKELRKKGNFQAAIEQGLPHISDFKVLIQINWAYYGLIKQQVEQALSQSPPPFQLIEIIYDTARAYAKLPNRRADSSLSNILRELGKIAAHSPNYLRFVYWVLQINGMQDSDWQATEYQGKRYSPLVYNVARSLAKWANAFPQKAQSEDLHHIIGWLEKTRSIAEGDDKLWLDWDRVKLLKQLGKYTEAVKVLSSVLKVKRGEFWVWQEAGRLYAQDQPDLAIACYCRALECRTKPEFTVNVHKELAQILAEHGEITWAIAETLAALDIRQKHNWKIGNDLQQIMNESWYDPTVILPNRSVLYTQYAPNALTLCFDDVYEQQANFAGVLELPSKQNSSHNKIRYLSKFIIKIQENKAISLLSTNNRIVSDCREGDPVLLTIGATENGEKTIMYINPRTDGSAWDCAQQITGVVQDNRNNSVGLFLNRDEQVKIRVENWQGDKPEIGTYAVLFTATNPKKDRTEVLFAKPCEICEMKDVKFVSGSLKRHEKGFAFVEDVFVAPYLLNLLADNVQQVEAISVYAKNPKKSEYGWKAVSLLPNL